MVPLLVDMEVTHEEFSGGGNAVSTAKPWRGLAVGAAFAALAFVGYAQSSWFSPALPESMLLEQGTLKPRRHQSFS